MEAAIGAFIAKGTPSGWTLCILVAAGLVLLAKIALGQRVQMREIDISEGGILRVAIAAEMKGLREEVAGLREENGDLRGELRKANAIIDGLRTEVRALHAIIDGMRREALTGQLATQAAVARKMGDEVPPATRAALDRLDKYRGVGE